MFDKMVNGAMAAMSAISSGVKRRPSDYCDLETVDAPTVLVSNQGALVSILEIHGVKKLIGANNYYNHVIAGLNSSLSTLFETKAHSLQIVFEIDHDRTAEQLRRIQQPSVETCKRLNLDLDELFEARVKVLSGWTAAEKCYVALWTNPDALSKSEQKEEKKQKIAILSDKVTSVMGQNPLAATAMIRNKHLSFVQAVKNELMGVDVTNTLLSSAEALRVMRESIDPTFVSESWEPSMPGDKVYPAQRQDRAGLEVWDILWPTLGSQLFPRDVKYESANVVRVGDRIFSPVYMDLFPKKPEFFSSLFARAMEKNIPWRISFLLEGAGLSGFGFKAQVASMLKFASSGNQMIDNAYKQLSALQNKEGETIVQARVAACTWAPAGQNNLLARRASDLATCLQNWGGAEVSEVTGDPLAGLASTIIGFSKGSIATKTAAPLDEFLAMMPWARPSSPWTEGAVTFRSPDGKIMPYQPYSNKQSTWINLIFAKPGSGKSVLMNMCNLALAIAPGATRLPRIAIIDIGPSSSGLITLLRESMPADLRHQVIHRRLRMVESDSINPFDTQLGCRFPTPTELTFLRNLVTMLATDFDSETPSKGIPNLASAVVDEMYRFRSDKNEPIRYSAGMDNLVDSAIKKHNISVDSHSTWWEVVDSLFAVDEIHAAQVAQRNAVPLLSDAIAVARSEKIAITYGNMKVTDTGETLIDAFCRMIGDALGMYPIMARPTAFDVGDARIVALDLDEVAKSGGVVADRQTAVMYMLARQVLAKDFFLSKEIVSSIPAPPDIELRDTVPVAKYKEYHEQRIRELKEDPKRICYDEFHRTSSAKMVRDQVLVDMREGRKWKVDIMLASQDLLDFDPIMIKQATGVFVMDGGNATTIEEIAQTFGFSDPAEKNALQNRVHAPRKGGGTFLAKFSTNEGWYTMLLSATLAPSELWAFSTTAEDVAIRDRLYERIGQSRTLKILSKVYPNGSASEDINQRKQRMQGDKLTNGKPVSAIEQIIEDLIDLSVKSGL